MICQSIYIHCVFIFIFTIHKNKNKKSHPQIHGKMVQTNDG